MDINPGDMISISHYSSTSPFKSTVILSEDDSYTVQSDLDLSVKVMKEGDHLVMAFLNDDVIYLASSRLISINTKDKTLRIGVESIKSIEDKEFPVALYAEVKTASVRKRQRAIVKSIGVYEMQICSLEAFDINERLEIEFYLERKVFFLYTDVKSITQCENDKLYGLQITYMDFNSINTMRVHLSMLKNQQERFVREIKNDLRGSLSERI